VSKRSRGRKKRSTSQIVFIGLSAILAFSMIISLIIVALPGPPAPTPTPWPTWTPFPTRTPAPQPSATPVPPEPTPTEAPTESPIGPQLPTPTPAITPTVTATPAALVPSVLPVAAVEPSPTAGERDTFTFAVCGDSRDNARVYRRVLDAVAASDAEFLINTGDLVNKGTETQWRDFREIMAGFPLPFYPVPGNHDGLDGSLEGYLASSGAPAAHYSFERGPVHFTLADSHNGGITAAELDWLRQDLSATDRPIKMVFLHHPPFDPDGTDHIMAFGNEAFMGLMVEQGVDYVFAGHIHTYAREARDGVLYTITGGAGAPLYKKDHPQSFHHYLQVTVRGEEVEIEVVGI
jgi:predicted phosphodiesterase